MVTVLEKQIKAKEAVVVIFCAKKPTGKFVLLIRITNVSEKHTLYK